MNEQKVCSHCGKTKPLSEYNKRYDRTDKLQPFCRTCDNIKSKKDYDENKEQRKRKRWKWITENRGKFNEIARKYQAAGRGILSPAHIAAMDKALEITKKGQGILTRVGTLNLYVYYDGKYNFSYDGELLAFMKEDFTALVIMQNEHKYNKKYLNRIKAYFSQIKIKGEIKNG